MSSSRYVRLCFNSKLVRLKAMSGSVVFRLSRSFNSKLVRLKASIGPLQSGVESEFQFQTGAIKSWRERWREIR